MKLAKKAKGSLGGFWRQSGRAIKKASSRTSTVTRGLSKKVTQGPTTVVRKFPGFRKSRYEFKAYKSNSVDSPDPGVIVYQEPDGLGQILTIRVY